MQPATPLFGVQVDSMAHWYWPAWDPARLSPLLKDMFVLLFGTQQLFDQTQWPPQAAMFAAPLAHASQERAYGSGAFAPHQTTVPQPFSQDAGPHSLTQVPAQ